MKKIILGICLLFLSIFTFAQNGLEGIIVEKYYVANAADDAGSVGTLPTGSVTYRIYADMLPGYKFQAAYGIAAHVLTVSTTTTFFNNEDRGATTPTYTKLQAKGNSVMLDSWLSVGAACSGNFGILKSEDDVALGGATVVNSNGILANTDPSAGIPLTTQDGLWAGAPQTVTFVGITAPDLDPFDAVSQTGNSLIVSNGSWASLTGSTGPVASTNKVLIGQFTTDGVFHYELNLQIGTPIAGGVQNFVASNPTGAEISIPSLTGTYGAVNQAPTVSITSPTTGSSFLTGAIVAIAATAADADGNVASVQFFVDGVSIGTDITFPYTANYTSTVGPHNLTAVATDNNGATTTSLLVVINVANNPAPTCSITAPAAASSFIVGDIVAITANATDNVSVASVEFFVDAVSIGTDLTLPYAANYTAVLGNHSLTAKATDNLGATTTSAPVAISVVNNVPPTVNITAPLGGALYTAPAVVTINANAADADGSVTQVQFFVNALLVGTDATFPYSFNWTSVIGTANLTAKVTDNRGAITTSSTVTISIADPNALPYKVVTSAASCSTNSFCIPLAATDLVNNIIGYDVIMAYDKTKVTPTGVITVSSDLITPSYVSVINNIDAANGLINISAYFNSSAPSTAKFFGQGNIFCVEFTKTVNFTSIDTAVISITSLQESYYTGVVAKLVDAGKFTSYKDSIFSGKLKFMDTSLPISYDAANPTQYLITNIFGNNSTCTSLSATAVQPNVAGNFSYVIQNGANININKDIAPTTDVQPIVNGSDALLANKVLLNNLTFTPTIYQMIAMDVNTDGVISAGDVSQINQRAVLMIPEFKQAWNYNIGGVSNGQLSKDWLFMDTVTVNTNLAYKISATYPSNDGIRFSKAKVPVLAFCLPVPVIGTDCPIIKAGVFRGVLLGDIDGNFATVSPSNLFRTDDQNKVTLDLSKAFIHDGFVDVPVSVVSTSTVNALDFAMKFNEGSIVYNTVLDHTNKLQALANLNADDNTLRFTSNSLNNYDLGKSLVSVRFAMKSSQLTQADFNSLAGYINGSRVAFEVIGARLASDNSAIITIYPNPASSSLSVVVSENAIVQLLDMEGREVLMQTNVNANQSQEINTQSLASGVYLMKVSNENFVSVKKVVIKK